MGSEAWGVAEGRPERGFSVGGERGSSGAEQTRVGQSEGQDEAPEQNVPGVCLCGFI